MTSFWPERIGSPSQASIGGHDRGEATAGDRLGPATSVVDDLRASSWYGQLHFAQMQSRVQRAPGLRTARRQVAAI
jgi:hypothetical protein